MIVNTSFGQVQGVQEGQLNVFRNIPYAAPPIGERRFAPPTPPLPWEGVLQADRFGPLSYQPNYFPGTAREQSEDCLTLNIWTSGLEQANKPVLVDIHGGGFTTGTGADFNGFTFAEREHIVCVSFNYRLGALGFLYLGDLLGESYKRSGNNGLLDIVAALHWVKENISSFGGDPNRITLSGGSAGAKCTATMLAVPAAKGLFHQIIAQSGATQAIRDTQTAHQITLALLDKLGLPHDEAHRLLTLPAQTIVEAQDNNIHTFGPVRDGQTISEEPIAEILASLDPKIPMLMGTNKDEAVLFTMSSPEMKEPNEAILRPLFGSNSELVWAAYLESAKLSPDREAWNRTLTNHLYRIATIRLAELAASGGQPVWLYRFEFPSSLGAIHGLENVFITNHSRSESPANDEQPMATLFSVPPSGDELAACMHAAWAAFIHSGHPHVAGFPEWKKFTLSERSIMILNQNCHTESEPELPVTSFPNQVLIL